MGADVENWLLVGLSGTAASTEIEGLEAGMIVDRYRLVDEQGRGGCGIVWKALQLDLYDKPVALKFVRPEFVQRMTERFEAERQVLARMTHACIVGARGIGMTASGDPYLVMEWIDGVPLTQFCDEQRMSVTERLQIFTQVCDGVQHAHQKGILHRDLKPSNILVEKTNEGLGLPKIIDFGIAAVVEDHLHGSAHAPAGEESSFGPVGTPRYMSPEQVTPGADMEVTSDIYALGTVLYELLTSAAPLITSKRDLEPFDSIAWRICNEAAIPPSRRILMLGHVVGMDEAALARKSTVKQLAKHLSGDLDAIILKALEKKPSARYQSASDLANDIGRYLRGKPVLARGNGRSYVLGKWVARNRLLCLFGVAAGLSVLGLIWSTALSSHAERERLLAQIALQEEVASQQKVAAFLGGIVTEMGGRNGPVMEPHAERKILEVVESRRESNLLGNRDMFANITAMLASGYLGLGDLSKSEGLWLEVWELRRVGSQNERVQGALARLHASWCGYLASCWGNNGLDGAWHGGEGDALDEVLRILDAAILERTQVTELGGIADLFEARWMALILKSTQIAFSEGADQALHWLSDVRSSEWGKGLSKSAVSGWFFRQEAILQAKLHRITDALVALEKGRILLASLGPLGKVFFRYPAQVEMGRLKGEILLENTAYTEASAVFQELFESRNVLSGRGAPKVLLRAADACEKAGDRDKVSELVRRAAGVCDEQNDLQGQEVALRRLVELYRKDKSVTWDTFINAKIELAALTVERSDGAVAMGGPRDESTLNEAKVMLGALPPKDGGLQLLDDRVIERFYTIMAGIEARLSNYRNAALLQQQSLDVTGTSKDLQNKLRLTVFLRAAADHRAELAVAERELFDELEHCTSGSQFAVACIELLLSEREPAELKMLDDAAAKWENLEPGSDELAVVRGLREIRRGRFDVAIDWLPKGSATVPRWIAVQAELARLLAVLRSSAPVVDGPIQRDLEQFKREYASVLAKYGVAELPECSLLQGILIHLWLGEVNLAVAEMGAADGLAEPDKGSDVKNESDR